MQRKHKKEMGNEVKPNESRGIVGEENGGGGGGWGRQHEHTQHKRASTRLPTFHFHRQQKRMERGGESGTRFFMHNMHGLRREKEGQG
jgi:hypothetical protein